MTAKTVAGEVSDARVDAPLTLTGSLVGLHFLRATAKRLNTGDARRIDLTFRARVAFEPLNQRSKTWLFKTARTC